MTCAGSSFGVDSWRESHRVGFMVNCLPAARQKLRLKPPPAIRNKLRQEPHTMNTTSALGATLNFREIDLVPEDVLNRILWPSLRGSRDPYPEWAISPDAEDEEEQED